MRRSTRKHLSTALSAALVAGLAVGVPTSAGAADLAVFDDFEDGSASDWGFFGNGKDAGGGGVVAGDRAAEGMHYLSTGWGGQGTTSVYYGGTFKNLDNGAQVALPPDPVFNMWVLNQSNATVDGYTLEVTLREDKDGDGWTNGAEDSMRFDTTFTSAQFDDTWTLLRAPLSSWTDLGTGGNGVLEGAIDEMVIVIAGVTGGSGSTIEVDFDTIWFTSGAVIDDFESGVAPGTLCPAGGLPLNFCTFKDTAPVTTISIGAAAPPEPLAGSGTSVLKMDVTAASYAGFTHGFTDAAGNWKPQNWSTREGISFWMFGSNSGQDMFIDILDNRNPGSTTDDAERFVVPFEDNFTGWQRLEFPFSAFTRKEIGNEAPNDGLTLSEIHGYALGTRPQPTPERSSSTTSPSTALLSHPRWP